MKKHFALLIIANLIWLTASAQRPSIVSLDKLQGRAGEIVTINGTDFGTNAANIRVRFGAAEAEVKSAGNQLIEAIIPAGASYDNVSVTRTDSRLTTYSKHKFMPSYGGEHGLSATTTFPAAQTNFDAQQGLYDLCSCDFNGDGKVDVAASGGDQTISVFANTSTGIQNISLTKTEIIVNEKTLNIDCGDLNGDGLPEIVLTKSGDGDMVLILRNNGGMSFTLIQPIILPGVKVRNVVISDLDLDGKPELIVADKSNSARVAILRNISTPVKIDFAAPVFASTPGVTTDAIEVADLNNDALPEIIALESLGNLFIMTNKSTQGNFDFTEVKSITSDININTVKAADIDGDQKLDLVTTRLINHNVQILRNTSSDGVVSFASEKVVPALSLPWTTAFADLDGDAKLDMVVTSIYNAKNPSDPQPEIALMVYNNTSTPGTISFATGFKLRTDYITRHLELVDMDNDAKPDIVVTSVDDYPGQSFPSDISIIRNAACMVPKVTPEGPLTICDGVQIPVSASFGATTYQWTKDGTAIPASNDADYIIEETGEFRVTAISEGGACSKVSNVVDVTVAAPGAGLNGNDPAASGDSPVCVGNDLNLEVADVGATEYRWRGPNGFTATGRQVTRPDFTMLNTGLYTVEMIVNGCVALIDSTIIEGIDIPEFSIVYSGDDAFCEGLTKTLSVLPSPASGFVPSWVEETQGEVGNQSTFVVSDAGTYTVKVTPPFATCEAVESAPVTLVKVFTPVVNFEVDENICLGTQTPLNNLSTADGRANVIYDWTFGTGDKSSLHTPEHTYASAGAKTISLTIRYDGIVGCTASANLPTNVLTPVLPVISASKNEMCAGDTVVLSVQEGFINVEWSTGEEGDTVSVYNGGTYTVTTMDINNCELTADETIIALTPPEINIVTKDNKTVIYLGESINLEATGGTSYTWSPPASLSQDTGAIVVATPQESVTYTVIGESSSTPCLGEATITIEVLGEKIAISPPAVFTPNGDAVNEEWVIPGVLNYGECTMNIFDSRGRRVFEKTGYQNDWKGTYNGNALPNGVYYFVFSCPDKPSVTGTVTVVR